MSSTYTDPRAFLFLTPPTTEGAGVHKELRGGTAGTDDPKRPKENPTLYGVMFSAQSWGKEKKLEDIRSEGVCHPKSLLIVMGPCFPG